MNNLALECLPNDFVRYVYEGCIQLGERLAEEPELAGQIGDVIREQLSRTPVEALEIETGLAILAGEEIAKAVTGCLRFLETHDEMEDLKKVGFADAVLRLIRYPVARYGPVLKAIRRRNSHPLGWHKYGHAITQMETGCEHLHIKLLRNDDQVLILEDDTESILRLVNFMLKSLEQVDDYQIVEEQTIQDFMLRSETLIGKMTESGALRRNRTEH